MRQEVMLWKRVLTSATEAITTKDVSVSVHPKARETCIGPSEMTVSARYVYERPQLTESCPSATGSVSRDMNLPSFCLHTFNRYKQSLQPFLTH